MVVPKWLQFYNLALAWATSNTDDDDDTDEETARKYNNALSWERLIDSCLLWKEELECMVIVMTNGTTRVIPMEKLLEEDYFETLPVYNNGYTAVVFNKEHTKMMVYVIEQPGIYKEPGVGMWISVDIPPPTL